MKMVGKILTDTFEVNGDIINATLEYTEGFCNHYIVKITADKPLCSCGGKNITVQQGYFDLEICDQCGDIIID